MVVGGESVAMAEDGDAVDSMQDLAVTMRGVAASMVVVVVKLTTGPWPPPLPGRVSTARWVQPLQLTRSVAVRVAAQTVATGPLVKKPPLLLPPDKAPMCVRV